LASAALSKKESGCTTATKTTDQVVARLSATITCVNAPNLEKQATTLNFKKADANALARECVLAAARDAHAGTRDAHATAFERK
jgi:hypothetical protein